MAGTLPSFRVSGQHRGAARLDRRRPGHHPARLRARHPGRPHATGFNHAGLTIARKGGILVDLRRMDKTCSFDEEAMTVSISPAVRMRSIWWEAIKHGNGRVPPEADPSPHLWQRLPALQLCGPWRRGHSLQVRGNPDSP